MSKILKSNDRQGNTVVTFEGNFQLLERLLELQESGELEKILGVPVLDIDACSQIEQNESSKNITMIPNQVNLTKWFENIFTTGWQTVTELLNPQQLQATARTQKFERGKLIDLRADLLSHSVVLLINLSRENDDSSIVGITLRVYPTGNDIYLPPSLKLLVLSNNKVFEEVTARSADIFMRCQFEGEVEEEFSVQLVLGDVVVTEDFVI